MLEKGKNYLSFIDMGIQRGVLFMVFYKQPPSM